jgi:hypothetical protein
METLWWFCGWFCIRGATARPVSAWLGNATVPGLKAAGSPALTGVGTHRRRVSW